MYSGSAAALAKVKRGIWFSPEASQQVRNLEPVFAKLQSIHELFINRSGDCDSDRDCVYWYHERSHVGLLSAAVWLCGGIALEEYGDVDGTEQRRRDLWFRVGKTAFNCEAKYRWLNFSAREFEDSLSQISSDLKYACAQLRKVDEENRLAICFAVPAFREAQPDKAIIETWTQRVREECRLQASVWVAGRVMKGNDGRYCPGVLVAVQEIKDTRRPNNPRI